VSTMSPLGDPNAWRARAPRRGLNREEAAVYVGISPSKFDELVKVGRMPKPKKIDGRRIFDVRALDLAFDELPSVDDANPWDGGAL
jgi:predicted DNA-binding transcriptional regulator AlpA